ncbi:hypothetical protein [Actinomadura sp. HBU206391]|uniref:hypothetical protein n=1 Tax=Actinomadura sp. HBU206391 TaxID=2731692 RepID=UPI00164FD63A|nr:hypothetical protein [Actinomadura sp. HBU206391]MBC6461477.1 hypothetical protein [Actinomadura sp. HBU206391]
MSRAGIGRRSLLHGVGALSLPIILGGCSKKRLEELKPQPDVAVLTAVMAAEEQLIALYEAMRTTHPELGRRLDPPLANHRDHLSALRRHYRSGTAPKSPSASASAPPPPAAAPDEPAQALATLRLAERQAAAARLRDVERVQPGFAQLLASIGACEAGHAMVLARVR